ncbi:transient receptor potential cation channel subfamily V member 5-like [Latimeria chalumnae]|uniref:transient receptor potential cation channel subfamily V member 5-like n=1 Tax=Latimeria chalumnae TaxID=7897 RepID=UPI00313E6C7F
MHIAVNMEETLRKNSELFRAARTNDVATMVLLLEQKDINPFTRGETPLHIAILRQDLESVKELLKRGADVVHAQASGTCFVPGAECQCYFGEFVLSFAACLGNESIVKILIRHNAPLKAQDNLGNTVLHVLVLQKDKEMAYRMYDLITSLVSQEQRQLVENIENNEGLTPLKLAASQGDPAVNKINFF